MSTRSQKKNQKKKKKKNKKKKTKEFISQIKFLQNVLSNLSTNQNCSSWGELATIFFLASWLVCVSVSEMYHFTNINVNYGGIAARLIIRDRLSLPYIDSIPRLVGVSLLNYLHVHVIHDSDKNTFHTLFQIFNQR